MYHNFGNSIFLSFLYGTRKYILYKRTKYLKIWITTSAVHGGHFFSFNQLRKFTSKELNHWQSLACSNGSATSFSLDKFINSKIWHLVSGLRGARCGLQSHTQNFTNCLAWRHTSSQVSGAREILPRWKLWWKRYPFSSWALNTGQKYCSVASRTSFTPNV